MGREGEVRWRGEVREEDRRGCGEGRRWRWRLDADADAGIGAVLTAPLGAQKICSIAPGFILVVLPASAFLLSLSLNLMETRMHVHLLALSGGSGTTRCNDTIRAARLTGIVFISDSDVVGVVICTHVLFIVHRCIVHRSSSLYTHCYCCTTLRSGPGLEKWMCWDRIGAPLLVWLVPPSSLLLTIHYSLFDSCMEMGR